MRLQEGLLAYSVGRLAVVVWVETIGATLRVAVRALPTTEMVAAVDIRLLAAVVPEPHGLDLLAGRLWVVLMVAAAVVVPVQQQPIAHRTGQAMVALDKATRSPMVRGSGMAAAVVVGGIRRREQEQDMEVLAVVEKAVVMEALGF
jgi:hypothetical protein